jgi:hypothetical protein
LLTLVGSTDAPSASTRPLNANALPVSAKAVVDTTNQAEAAVAVVVTAIHTV